MQSHKLPYCIVVIVALSVVAAGCSSNAPDTDPQLQGKWEVYQAERNGAPTETLNGAEFRFDDAGQMATNITGQYDSATYDLIDLQILYHGIEEAVYDIRSFSQDSMVLVTNLRGMHFQLRLHKSGGK